jgi:hypothetical protein
MYGAGQIKVMIVGGPNQRKDFHIEEGEVVSQIGDLVVTHSVETIRSCFT